MALEKADHKLANNLRARWRPRIVKRDPMCRACLRDYAVDGFLEVAHITPMREFRRVLGPNAGTRHSFRYDNLVALCSACHAAQETGDLQRTSTLVPSAKLHEWVALQLKEYPGKTAAQVLQFQRREPRVRTLFSELMVERGWTTVQDLAVKEKLDLDIQAVPEPVFDPVDPASLPPAPNRAGTDVLDRLEECVLVAGGRVLRKGLASDFVKWYEHHTRQPYLFTQTDAPALIYHRPRTESLVGKIQRRFQLENLGVVRQLKVDAQLYLLQVHPS